MSKKESHPSEVSQSELELLEALRTAPVLTEEVTAMLKGFATETDKGMDAHQAELHAVELTRKLGKLLITQWAGRTENEQSQQSSLSPDLIKHGKKNSPGKAPSDA
jgi:hypothetical protein